MIKWWFFGTSETNWSESILTTWEAAFLNNSTDATQKTAKDLILPITNDPLKKIIKAQKAGYQSLR